MDSKKQPKQPKQPNKPKSKSKSKKTVPNVVIAERISINLNTKRRAQMIRRAPKPAGIDTSDILNKGYLLQKAIATRTAPQSQTQSINLYLDSYGQLEKQQQKRRIDDDIQAFRIKAERGVDSSLVNPAIARLQQLRNIPQKEAPFIDVYDPISQRQYASESEVRKIQSVRTGASSQRVPSPFVAEIRDEVVSTKNLEGTVPVPVRRVGRPTIARSVEATEFIAKSPEVAKEVAMIIDSERKKQQARIRTKLEEIDDPQITAGGGVRGRSRKINIDAGPAISERQTELRRAQPPRLTREDQGQQESLFGGGAAVPIRLRKTEQAETKEQSQLRTIQSNLYNTDVDFQESED